MTLLFRVEYRKKKEDLGDLIDTITRRASNLWEDVHIIDVHFVAKQLEILEQEGVPIVVSMCVVSIAEMDYVQHMSML